MSLFLFLCCCAFTLFCIFISSLRLFLGKWVSFHYIFPLIYFLIVLVEMLDLWLLMNYFHISRLRYLVNQLGYMHLTESFPWLIILKKRFSNRLLSSNKNLISPLLNMCLTINIFIRNSRGQKLFDLLLNGSYFLVVALRVDDVFQIRWIGHLYL